MAIDARIWGLAVAAMCLTGGSAAASVVIGKDDDGYLMLRGPYRNIDYAFAVRVPKGFRYLMPPPPSPNHGFDLVTPGGREIYIFAGYTDERDLAGAVSAEIGFRPSCRVMSRNPDRLGGRAAVELQLRCPPEKGRRSPRLDRLMITYAIPPGRSPIVYQVELKRDIDDPRAAEADAQYRALKAGFYFLKVRP